MPATAQTAHRISARSARHPATVREHIDTRVFGQPDEVNRAVAAEIAAVIKQRADQGKNAVLGLATGSTPTGIYSELIRLHREEGLSFKNVVTFNLDEYWPMQRDELQSYVRFMNEHLFDHLDIPRSNIHIPDGTLAADDVPGFCTAYEQRIDAAGGLDIQLLGIGRTGHIGFNEPGSSEDSRTRMIWLDRVTRLDAASDFFGLEHVPKRAITMGVGTIMAARRVILVAFGEGKAPVVAKAIEGEVTPVVAASFLQHHDNTTFFLDGAAAASLTRFATPWLVGDCAWDDALTRKAVTWLALTLDKPILKLTEEDYNEHHLQGLVAAHGPAYNINVDVFGRMQRTITGWPAGKPKGATRPTIHIDKGDAVFPKRCLIFSPHPDDDVISMGGTLIRLADQGHEVHVAYQVSGSIAVFDEDAVRFTDFASDFNRAFGIDQQQTDDIEDHIERFIKNKQPGQVDSPETQKIKALIRRGEARAAGRACGVPYENLHFLDMPFYETGTVRKKPIGDADVRIIADLLEKIQPHQVYCAGDLSDPHGTHRVCLQAIFAAIDKVKQQAWYDDCEVWLYRGAWQEWEPERIELAVPISPEELMRKRHAIFKHESQKDKALFPGSDPREFWQRAEDRNRATAAVYDRLGLAEYEAIEAFVKWNGQPVTKLNPVLANLAGA